MQIIRAKPEDAATLTRIAFAAKRHWNYPVEWIADWAASLTIQPEFIASHETWVAWRDGQSVGFHALRRGPADRMFLEHLWVLPEAMGRGVGRILFEHAATQASAAKFTFLEIESDPNAAGFYERMGARRTGTVVTEAGGRRRELPVLLYET